MNHNQKILLVDDNPINLELLEEILEGFWIRSASSGEEALKIGTIFCPDLVLLDVMMPGLNGYEVCRKFREESQYSGTKIVMVSAKSMTNDRLEGYEAGADDYIAKPFDRNEILAKVRVYLRLKSAEEVSQLKSDILALLCHETSTPINTIIGPLEMLMEEKDLGVEERLKWYRMMHESATQLHALQQKALTLCTMKSGIYEFDFQPVDISLVIEDAIEYKQTMAKERNISILKEINPNAKSIADSKELSGVIESLLDNAIKYSPGDSQILVNLELRNGFNCLEIVDQGKGIATKVLAEVFQGLCVENISHHTRGFSLNLAIAHQVALHHEAIIEAKNNVPQGTRISFRIPSVASSK